VFFFSSACALLLGNPTLRVIAFPMAFLIFMAPLPSVLEHGLETFLQHASADAAYVLLKLSGMPILREGTQFQMPGIRIEIAPECSGIHSSLVLFVTSLLAGHFFLRRLWTKVTLSLSVILLGILRNAVRIFTLSQLCVHVDPHIFDSPLHHKGGPLFFVASLLPFCLLLWFLRKIEFSRNGERDYI
jgi:exosortase C (VPDSG-CTERM-specific)